VAEEQSWPCGGRRERVGPSSSLNTLWRRVEGRAVLRGPQDSGRDLRGAVDDGRKKKELQGCQAGGVCEQMRAAAGRSINRHRSAGLGVRCRWGGRGCGGRAGGARRPRRAQGPPERLELLR